VTGIRHTNTKASFGIVIKQTSLRFVPLCA
jgi:hypothetical protein